MRSRQSESGGTRLTRMSEQQLDCTTKRKPREQWLRGAFLGGRGPLGEEYISSGDEVWLHGILPRELIFVSDGCILHFTREGKTTMITESFRKSTLSGVLFLLSMCLVFISSHEAIAGNLTVEWEWKSGHQCYYKSPR